MVVGKGWLVRKGEKWRSISPLTEMVTTDEEDELREEDGIIRSGTQHPNLSEKRMNTCLRLKGSITARRNEGRNGKFVTYHELGTKAGY